MAETLNISDDLHGIVHLDPHERRLVDSPYLQRLRRIRQLGLTHMVFPGAEHTRLAHSIGVFHLASRVAVRLEEREHLTPEESRELRAAALLHDIGHFPFSHSLEKVYEGFVRPSPVSWTARRQRRPDTPRDTAESSKVDDVQFHEAFGRRLIEETEADEGITRILRESCLDPKRVGSIVVGVHENVLLNQIIHSDLDVDQLDYLLRDAKATGSTYGHYDLDYLIECLEVVYIRTEQLNPVLCVTLQGLHPLEHYVLARYFYYLCVLYQKTRCVAEGALQEVVRHLIRRGRLPSWRRVATQFNQQWFRAFDDVYVWSKLRAAARDPTETTAVRAAVGALLNRQLPKVKSEAHPTLRSGQSLPASVPSGPTRDIRGRILRNAVRNACCQRFTVLHRSLPRRGNRKQALQEVLLLNPRPIRLLVKDPYTVPRNTPSMPCYDRAGGQVGRIVLLESLQDSIVAKLAGLTTHIARVYRAG